AETRKFSGKVVVIFQPAEEGGGGAKVMCDEGLMDRFGISQVYAIHNWPGLTPGRIEFRPGPTMAAADRFFIKVKGKGGHAAFPQDCIDPLLIGAQIVTAAQHLVAREVDPRDSAVVSICTFQCGTTGNVIADTASLEGTVRTLKPETRDLLERRLGEVVEGIAKAAGGAAEFEYLRGYPTTISTPENVAFAARVARDLVGDDQVRADRPPEMGSEDFSYMLEERPGAYIYLGQGDTAGLHNPEYDFNDEVAPVGASLFAALVERAQPLP
ncbi:MAG: amidohydrolase, partial [Pseudomonadota bacterium]